MAGTVIVNARAPVRLDFAGGWTDVAPFAVRERGVVVNAAIGLYAHATLETGSDRYRLEARDLDAVVEADSLDQIGASGTTSLLAAAVRMYRLPPCRLVTWSEVPPGSGLGSSGAIGVALIAACEAAAGRRPGPAEIAERAWELETIEAALPGGRQDQYAAALGGFHRLEFDATGVTVQGVEPAPGFVDLLAERTVICYTGSSRVSSNTIARVMDRYESGDVVVVEALREMAIIAAALPLAFAEGDLPAVAASMARNWRLQQQLDAGMATPEMTALATALDSAGALGGKAAGSGAGGSMFFLLDRDRRDAVRVARELGSTVLPLTWAREGVTVW